MKKKNEVFTNGNLALVVLMRNHVNIGGKERKQSRKPEKAEKVKKHKWRAGVQHEHVRLQVSWEATVNKQLCVSHNK